MTQVAKKQAEVINAEIEKAVKAILEKHNMEITKFRGKYGDILGFSIEATPINRNENGINVSTPEAREFLQYGKDHGFENPAEILGKTFVVEGKTYKFAGLNLNKPKFAVVAIEVKSGKQFGFTKVALRKIEGFNPDLVLTWMRDDFKLPSAS